MSGLSLRQMTDGMVDRYAEVEKWVTAIAFRDYAWRLDQLWEGGLLLSASFTARDGSTQRTRKWYLSPHATESEIVQTVLLLVKVSEEHELREEFTYQGRDVFTPHYAVGELASLTTRDARAEVPA